MTREQRNQRILELTNAGHTINDIANTLGTSHRTVTRTTHNARQTRDANTPNRRPPIEDDPTWRTQAACIGEDPEVFYLEDARSMETAKLVCRGCPVKAECLNDAARHEDWWGIRAGLLGPTRRRLALGNTPATPTNLNIDNEVTRLTYAGWKVADIAGYLNTSIRTVERSRARHRKEVAA